ncbi:MAG: manganese efflux pump [Clostridia bacterium]|nr:manganese efflux pump [Clostridia bacterium]
MILLLAASLSLDALAIAVAYALRSTRIPLVSKLVVCGISIIYFGVAVWLGGAISGFFSPETAKIVGIAMMACICLWTLFQVLFGTKKASLGKQVIRDPMLCDIDQSQSISPFEAIFLGTALSVDSISVGIGYSLLGPVSLFAPLAVGFFQLGFLCLGGWIGQRFVALQTKQTGRLQLISIAVMFVLILVRICD